MSGGVVCGCRVPSGSRSPSPRARATAGVGAGSAADGGRAGVTVIRSARGAAVVALAALPPLLAPSAHANSR